MKSEPIKIVIQFNCPKCRDADWGRGTEWVTVDRDLLVDMALVVNAMQPITWLSKADWERVKAALGWEA